MAAKNSTSVDGGSTVFISLLKELFSDLVLSVLLTRSLPLSLARRVEIAKWI